MSVDAVRRSMQVQHQRKRQNKRLRISRAALDSKCPYRTEVKRSGRSKNNDCTLVAVCKQGSSRAPYDKRREISSELMWEQMVKWSRKKVEHPGNGQVAAPRTERQKAATELEGREEARLVFVKVIKTFTELRQLLLGDVGAWSRVCV